jgi:tRNA threonylcarbamoyl adenosine modification protein YeaZ
MPRYALAIHTSSPELGLALCDLARADEPDGRVDRWQTWNLGQALSTHLHCYLNQFIQPQSWLDLAFLTVAKGPGSFTATRIGVVTARTLAQQLDIPLFAISTLAALAWSNGGVDRTAECADAANSSDMAVQMPASRDEIFAAIYAVKLLPNPAGQSELTALLPDSVMSYQKWEHILQTWHRPYRRIRAEAGLGTSVVGLLDLAIQEWQQGIRPDWTTALPYYGQHPVAP